MIDSVLYYFKAEKKASIYCIVVGLFSIALTIYFLLKGQPFYNGLSYALISVGLIQLIAGATIYFRSDMDVARVDYFIQKDFDIIKEKEIPRMDFQLKNLAIYRKVEIIFFVLGLMLWFSCKSLTLGKGIGIGLTIQSLIMFIFDYLAEQRGKVYFNFLKSIMIQQ